MAGVDVGVLGIVHEGGGASRVGLGWFDEFFVGVCEGGGLVDCVGEVCLEANLASKRPGAFHTWVVGERSEKGVVGGGEVFVYRVFWADSVGGQVVDGRKGGSLKFEDEAADSFGVKFDNDGRGGGVLLGGNGEGIGEDEVGRGNGVPRNVTGLFGCFEDGANNLAVHNGGDLGGWGGGGDGESEDAKGVGAKRLVHSVHFLGELIYDGVLFSKLLAEGCVVLHESADGLFQDVNLG